MGLTPKTRGVRSIFVRLTLIALATSTALSACTTDSDSPPSKTQPTSQASATEDQNAADEDPAAEPDENLDPDPEPTAEVSPEPEPEDRGPHPDNPDDLPEITPPGTYVSLTDSIVVRDSQVRDDEEVGWAVLRYAITDITEGDASLLKNTDNAEDYQDGGSVYYVRGTVEVLALSGTAIDGMVGGAVTGIQDDGIITPSLLEFMSTNSDCKGNFLISNADIGTKEDTCVVAPALPGTEVIGAAYYADTVISSDGPSQDPYFLDPVAWLP